MSEQSMPRARKGHWLPRVWQRSPRPAERRSTATAQTAKPWPRWPLVLLGAPAAVSIWSGWVGLGTMSGYGVVTPLPGIADDFQLNSAITLPIGMEAYSAIALGVWLSNRGQSPRARSFAGWSALLAMAIGLLGQVIYHLLTAWGYQRAPWQIVTLVACLPVLVLGAGATLYHLLRADHLSNQEGEVEAVGHSTATNPARDVAESVEEENNGERPAGAESLDGQQPRVEVDVQKLSLADWIRASFKSLGTDQDLKASVAWLAEQGIVTEARYVADVRRRDADKAKRDAERAKAEQDVEHSETARRELAAVG